MEKTLVIVKPDALHRNLLGQIISRFETKGLRLVGIKMNLMDSSMLEEHYRHLADEPFFAEIIAFMSSSPVVVTCWEGADSVATVRKLCGITKAREAEPGTIRGDWAMSIQMNLIHASDGVDAAKLEIARFFEQDELFSYTLHALPYLYTSRERD